MASDPNTSVAGSIAGPMASDLVVQVDDFPVDALPVLVADLAGFGAEIIFSSDRLSGVCSTIAGNMNFKHDGKVSLRVEVVEDLGHFSRLMILGGIRQQIQEAAERFRRSHASS